MRQAVVTFDEGVMAEWGFAAFQDAGIRDAEILSCEGSRGVIRVHVEERPDEERLDANDTIEWWEAVASRESEFVYLVEGAAERDPDSCVDVGRLPRTERVEVDDYGFTLTYTGRQAELGEMIAELEADGTDVTLRQLRGYRVDDSPLDRLTERQRDVLRVAFECGYYDVPREASTEEVAAAVDLDDSTVSEHLQRAERNLLAAVLGGAPEPG
jgi:predicted DNA binding protein